MLSVTIIILALFYYSKPILALAKASDGEDATQQLFHGYFEPSLAKIILSEFQLPSEIFQRILGENQSLRLFPPIWYAKVSIVYQMSLTKLIGQNYAKYIK